MKILLRFGFKLFPSFPYHLFGWFWHLISIFGICIDTRTVEIHPTVRKCGDKCKVGPRIWQPFIYSPINITLQTSFVCTQLQFLAFPRKPPHNYKVDLLLIFTRLVNRRSGQDVDKIYKCEILEEGKIYEWLFGMHEDYYNSLFRVATIWSQIFANDIFIETGHETIFQRILF